MARAPAMTVAHLRDLRLVSGLPVADLLTGDMQYSSEVPAPVMGGEEGTCIYAPPREGQVLAASVRGVLLPMAPVPPSAKQGFVPDLPDIGMFDVYPEQQTIDDLIIQHKGNRILLDDVGRMVISTHQDVLRMQLRERAVISVSQGDDAPEGRLALADQVTDALNALTRAVSDLSSRVQHIETALRAGIQQTAPVEKGFLALGGVYNALAATDVFSFVPDEIESDAIASSAFVVPSTSVDEV